MSGNRISQEAERQTEPGFVERHSKTVAFGTLGAVAGTGFGVILVEVASGNNELVLPTALVTVAAMAVAGAFLDRLLVNRRSN